MKILPNVLIVDDTEINLALLEAIIQNTQVNLIKALSGSEALEKTRGIELALAIIDVWMPKMNGYELALKLNEERSGGKVPIIFITANHFDEIEVFKGYGSGAVDYVFKPINSHILKYKINIFLDLFKQKQVIIRNAALLKKSADELTRTNASLKKSYEKYRVLYNNSPNMFVSVFPDSNEILLCNDTFLNKTGYSRKEIIGSSIFKIYHDDCMDEVKKAFQQFVETGVIKEKELILKRKDGSKIDAILNVHAVRNGAGKILYSVSSLRDITERKMVEQALNVSEEKYKTMLNASPDGILLIDLKGIITEVSEIGLELLGVENKNELIGKHFLRFLPCEKKNTVRQVIDKTINEGIAQNVEIQIKKKNQSLFLAEISSTLIQDIIGVPFSFMITIRDISLHKKLEKKLIHDDRMASLGEMASGIAHEINQPLNTISLVLDNILYEATKDENIGKDYLKKKSEKIFENITRIKNIIDHIRAFSRSHDDYILTGFDINSSIINAVSMISEQFKHLAIDLNLQIEENPPLIVGNTFKFEQVILNLLLNAKDAVLEKKSKQSEDFKMVVGIKSFQENQYLIIEITDNGTGIREEDIEHITLPFYTTKDTGKGTGLGLSISYQIIKELNGSIEIMNNVFFGTTFKIILKIQNKK